MRAVSGAEPVSSHEQTRRDILATGVIVGDLDPRTLAPCAGVSLLEATDAVTWGEQSGLITDGEVPATDAALLVAELGPSGAAQVHIRVARKLLLDGCACIDEVVHHTREAAALEPVPELVDLLEHTAKAALSTSDYATARALLELADHCGDADDLVRRSWRLCRLAEALDGLGRVEESRDAAARAFDLAEIAGDAALGIEAAVMSAFPADWYAGDLRTSGIIQRAEGLGPGANGQVALLGARALAEMRIPARVQGGHQVAWVTRAAVGQSLAHEALVRSTPDDPWERLVALLAWRTCHRSPRFLDQRRSVSTEALAIAQKLRLPARQVEAATMLGADAMESGDRPSFDGALAVARWVAQRDGNPRLLSHTRAMDAGAAYLDGDIESGLRLHHEAVEFAEQVALSSGYSLDYLLLAEYYVYSGEDPPSELIPRGEHPILAHPLAQTATSIALARRGEHETAEDMVHRALLHLDEESSMLLMLVLAAETALLLQSPGLIERLLPLLRPWAEHTAVDSNTWWVGGPVAASIAGLLAAIGDPENSRFAAAAQQTARSTGDIRTLRRLEPHLRDDVVPTTLESAGSTERLTQRQQRVLELLALGLTNREIARELSFSVSTVKADVASIFRTLGVANRAEAIRFFASRRLSEAT